MAPRWRSVVAFALVRLSLLGLVSCEYSVLDCTSFQRNFTNIFREYVSISDLHYETLYREWNSFCLGLNSSRSPYPADVRSAWSRYTSFRPLSSCQLRSRAEWSASTSTARTVAFSTNAHFATGESRAEAVSVCPCLVAGERSAKEDAVPADGEATESCSDGSGIWRLCFDVAELMGVFVLAIYAATRRIFAKYAVRRPTEHGDAVPESLFDHRDGP